MKEKTPSPQPGKQADYSRIEGIITCFDIYDERTERKEK